MEVLNEPRDFNPRLLSHLLSNLSFFLIRFRQFNRGAALPKQNKPKYTLASTEKGDKNKFSPSANLAC